MPLDPSISLQTQQFDPMTAYGKAMQLSSLLGQQRLQGMQIDQAERENRETQTLAELYKGNLNPDGSINRTGLIQSAADKGLGARIPGLQKQWNEADEAGAKLQKLRGEIGEQKFKALKDASTAAGNTAMSLLSGAKAPTETDVMQTFGSLVNQGVFDVAAELRGTTPDEIARQQLATMPRNNPEALTSWLRQLGMRSLDTAKQFEMITPKFEKVNTGKQTVFVDVNPVTNPKPGTLQMTTTPGEDLSASTSRANNAASNAVTMRGQNLTDARSRETNDLTRQSNRTQIINDPERGVLLVDKATGVVRSGVGADGNPLAGDQTVKRQAAARRTMPIIEEAERLINDSTGSYLGAAGDRVAQAFGASTDGAKAIAQLKVLEGQLMMAQPRMEGPQSNADVALYQQMAGQIGDPTVPRDTKRAALQAIRALQTKYAGAAPSVPSAPAAHASDWKGAGYASKAAAVQDARTAISKGADKAVVIKRLEAAGITNHGIK